MRLRFNWVILCFSIYISCYAQVSGSYCQKDAVMYSECYCFKKEQKTFVHESYTDDGQRWIGTGTYKEDRTAVDLTYEPVSFWPYNNLVVYPVTSDTAKIYWYNLWDEKQAWFQILVFDSNGNKVWVQEADEDVAFVPRNYCTAAYTFQLMSEGWQKITTFTLDEKTDEIHIYFNPQSLHTFKSPLLKLRKAKSGFIAWAMWAGKEKLFVEVKPLMPPPAPINNQCIRNSNYPTNTLHKRYPFSQANSIKLVAFEARHGQLPVDAVGNLRESECKQIIPLTQLQTDSLMDILYNYTYNDSLEISTKTYECYDPRHAIVFYNKSDKLFAYLEMCFECRGNTSNIKTANFGDFCDGKYELLKDFMKQSGITFFAEQDKSSDKSVEEPIIK